MKKFNTVTFWAVLVVSLFVIRATDVYGYGYGLRGKDTLVAVYENIIKALQTEDFKKIEGEVQKIEVPLANYHNYYGINLKPVMVRAISESSTAGVIIAIEQLIYFAVREKIYWNKKEKLEKFVASKARLKVIFQYYTVLKAKIEIYDEEHNTNYSSKIVDSIIGMKNTLGSSGAFGYRPNPPNLQEFIKLSSQLEKTLVTIFPHFEEGLKAVINPH